MTKNLAKGRKNKANRRDNKIVDGIVLAIFGSILGIPALFFIKDVISVFDFLILIIAFTLIIISALFYLKTKGAKKHWVSIILVIVAVILLVVFSLRCTGFIGNHNSQENPTATATTIPTPTDSTNINININTNANANDNTNTKVIASTPTPTPASPDKSSITITSPENGTVVGMEQQVKGTSENIPEGSKVWVAIRVGNRYYPQSEPWVDNTGHWICDARFGGVDDGGLFFNVIALIANREAQIELTEKSEFTVFPPIGAKEYDRITVIRETYTTPPTPPVEPSVTIISPINTDVGMWEWVSGTSKNIPVGQELWVVVNVDGLYFPHRVETLNADGTWRHNVQIGQRDEGGKLFELIAVLADGSAQKELREWYKNQDDLHYLPSGTARYSTVTVTRSVENFGEPSVTIRYPSNTDKVGIWEWVSGTSQNIPYGYRLWVVVRWDGLYFPMYDGVKINADGTWTYNTTIGQAYDGGRDFEIIVVLADGSAQEMINEWHQNPYDLYRLFPGMTKYSIVTVTRK